MAGKLRTIIRLHRWRLDEERRSLAEVLRQLEAKQSALGILEDEIRAEQESAMADPAIAGQVYAAFARAAIDRRETLVRTIAAAEEATSRQRERVQACWRELRTFELAEESRMRREAAEAARLERLALDEIALLRQARAAKSERTDTG